MSEIINDLNSAHLTPHFLASTRCFKTRQRRTPPCQIDPTSVCRRQCGQGIVSVMGASQCPVNHGIFIRLFMLAQDAKTRSIVTLKLHTPGTFRRGTEALHRAPATSFQYPVKGRCVSSHQQTAAARHSAHQMMKLLLNGG